MKGIVPIPEENAMVKTMIEVIGSQPRYRIVHSCQYSSK